MAVTNNVVFVLVDNKQSVDESKEIKALKYDLSQKDIEIANLKNIITTLGNTVSELKSDIKHIIPDLSEFDKFKLTPEYPKFKQEFLEAFVRFDLLGLYEYVHDGFRYRKNLIILTDKYEKYLCELADGIRLLVCNTYDSDYYTFFTNVIKKIEKKFDINYEEFAKTVNK